MFIEQKPLCCLRMKSSKKLLTNREREILYLTMSGFIAKEIAAKLNISKRTVDSHMRSIFKKLEARNKIEALIKALKNNYL